MNEKDLLHQQAQLMNRATLMLRALEQERDELRLKLEAVEKWLGFAPRTFLPQPPDDGIMSYSGRAILQVGIMSEYASGPEDLMREAFDTHVVEWDATLNWIHDALPSEWERIASGGDISARDFHRLATRSNGIISELNLLQWFDNKMFRYWWGHDFSYTANKLAKSMGRVYYEIKR